MAPVDATLGERRHGQAQAQARNPLLRLKELVEKVGRIDLHTGAGAGAFDALLTKLYTIGRETDAGSG